jgi:hypothetical protein
MDKNIPVDESCDDVDVVESVVVTTEVEDSDDEEEPAPAPEPEPEVKPLVKKTVVKKKVVAK